MPANKTQAQAWLPFAGMARSYKLPLQHNRRHHGLTCPTSRTWVMFSEWETPSTQSRIEGDRS